MASLRETIHPCKACFYVPSSISKSEPQRGPHDLPIDDLTKGKASLKTSTARRKFWLRRTAAQRGTNSRNEEAEYRLNGHRNAFTRYDIHCNQHSGSNKIQKVVSRKPRQQWIFFDNSYLSR